MRWISVGLIALVGCAAEGPATGSLSQDDTSVDLDAKMRIVSGKVTLNGGPFPGAHVFVRQAVAPHFTGHIAVADGSYTMKIPDGTHSIALSAPCTTNRSLPCGEMRIRQLSVTSDTTADLDLRVVKFTSHISVNGEPLHAADELRFREKSGDYLRFEDVTQLQPFEAQLPPGTYYIEARTRDYQTYPLATELRIE